jgi:thiamine-monophosphate kinase
MVGAIRRVLSGDGPGVLVGVGDDAALVETGRGGSALVLTSDMLVEGVHFERGLQSPRDLGAKAIVVNVSDIAAVAGSARYAVVGLALSPDVEPAWVMELYGGMLAACDEYALSLVGGDLSRADQVVISVTVAGEVGRNRAILRSGAAPGERIVVTGSLGAAAGGLLLQRAPAPRVSAALSSEWGQELLQAYARPVARVGEAQTLAQAGATAMMDLSDGLAKDLSRLCAESGVGARVRMGEVPVAAGLEHLAEVLPVAPLKLAMSGGEDYELLATLHAPAVEPARRKLRQRYGVVLTEVGEIIPADDGLVAIGPDGEEEPLEPRGWDHFDRP